MLDGLFYVNDKLIHYILTFQPCNKTIYLPNDQGTSTGFKGQSYVPEEASLTSVKNLMHFR